MTTSFSDRRERAWAERCWSRFVAPAAGQPQPRALFLLGTSESAAWSQEAARQGFRNHGGCVIIDFELLARLHPLSESLSSESLDHSCGVMGLSLLEEALHRRSHLLIRLALTWELRGDQAETTRLDESPAAIQTLLAAWLGRLSAERYETEVLLTATVEETSGGHTQCESPPVIRLIRVILPSPEITTETGTVTETERSTWDKSVASDPSPAVSSEQQPTFSREAALGIGVALGVGETHAAVPSKPAPTRQNPLPAPEAESPDDPAVARRRSLQANIRRLADAGPE